MIGGLICLLFVFLLFLGQLRIWKHRNDPKPIPEPEYLSEEGLSGMQFTVVHNRNAMLRGRSLGFQEYTIQCVNPDCPFRNDKRTYLVSDYFERKTPMPPCRSDCPGWPYLSGTELDNKKPQ